MTTPKTTALAIRASAAVTAKRERQAETVTCIKGKDGEKVLIRESKDGVWLEVTFREHGTLTTEELWAENRSQSVFWLTGRFRKGGAHVSGRQYSRDLQYPVGRQVKLG